MTWDSADAIEASQAGRIAALEAQLIAAGMERDRLLAIFQRDAGRGEADGEAVALREEVTRLRARLEISPDHPYDGIDCRDETIRQLERRVAELTTPREIAKRCTQRMNEELHMGDCWYARYRAKVEAAHAAWEGGR